MHILIVDDEKLLTWTMDRFLTRAGYQVTALNDPQMALQQCKQTSFDLLISDVLMPAMSGIELAAQVKDCQPDCRIILLSGQAATNDLLKGTRAESLPIELARKPIQPEELLDLIGGRQQAG